MKRLFLLILTVLLIFALPSCISPSPDDSSESTTGEIEPYDLNLVLDGESEYTIIVQDSAVAAVANAALNVRNEIKRLTKKELNYTTDFPESQNKDAYEILIGKTNKDESVKALEKVGYGEFIVEVQGNKIVLNGLSDESVTKAASKFIELLRELKDDDGNIVVSSTLSIKEKYDERFKKLWIDDIKGENVEIFNAGAKAFVIAISPVKADTAANYTQKLAQNGYSLYTENELNKNLFKTFVSSDDLLQTIYIPKTEELRVIIQPLSQTELPKTTADDKYTKICDPILISVGVAPDDETTYYNGMCYIFRLDDGSFIIYDGGWQIQPAMSRMYDALVKYAPDPNNIVVSAWVFTHGHSDHGGAFKLFANAYNAKVKVEKFIYNLPSAEVDIEFSMVSKNNDLRAAMNKFPSAEQFHALPGQKFYIRNAEIEIFYTGEMLKDGYVDVFNSTSIISRVTLEGQTFLMTGDIPGDSGRRAAFLYEDALISDFFQLPHHGVGEGRHPNHERFMSAVKPSYVLWPTSKYLYDRSAKSFSEFVYNKNNGVKDIFISFYRNIVLPLPYKGSGEIITPLS